MSDARMAYVLLDTVVVLEPGREGMPALAFQKVPEAKARRTGRRLV